MPGPLISKAQSGRVNIRTTQQIGRTWTEHYLVDVRSTAGRSLLATVGNYWRNGTIFTIDHRDHLTPLGAGGGSPLVNAAPQLVTAPENFGAWTNSGTPINIAGGQADPFGGTAAYTIEDDSAAAEEGKFQTVGFTADGEKCVSIFLRAGTAGRVQFGLWDNTAAAWRHRVSFAWAAGVPGAVATDAGAGTRFAVEPWGAGWYRISISATGVVAANTNQIFVRADLVATVGTWFMFGANAWNETTPARYAGPSQAAGTTGSSLYLNGGTASVTNWLRAGDILSLAGIAPVYEVAADVSTQANGYVVVPINPPIFTGGGPADNAAVLITGVTLTACILEPPTLPSTSGTSADYGELVVRFSESL